LIGRLAASLVARVLFAVQESVVITRNYASAGVGGYPPQMPGSEEGSADSA